MYSSIIQLKVVADVRGSLLIRGAGLLPYRFSAFGGIHQERSRDDH